MGGVEWKNTVFWVFVVWILILNIDVQKTTTMKIEGRISIFAKEDGVRIEIRDQNANVQFLNIDLTPGQFTSCLSRLSRVPCEIEVIDIDKVGKKHENDTFVFPISDYEYDKRDAIALQASAQSKLNDGWIADAYFGSQGSFFKNGDQCFARVNIRRWVDVTKCKCGNHQSNEPHSCPYQSDVHNDQDYLCNCCEGCTDNCAMEA